MNKSIITFIFIIAYSWKSLQANPNPPKTVEAICAKAPNPGTCTKLVKTDSRDNLKTTSKGVAIILVDQAKANIVSTKKFIQDNLPKVKEADVKEKMNDCLKAYEGVTSELDMEPSSLDTPDGRSDAGSNISSTEMDLSYDCEWESIKTHSPVIDQLTDMVHVISDCLESAAAILNAPA